jgi:hypothetical protein
VIFPKPDEPEPKKKKASRKGAKTRRTRKEFSLRCLCDSAALREIFFAFFAQISLQRNYRVVADTNVFLSGVLWARDAPGRIIRLRDVILQETCLLRDNP